jgi:mono/diheme cytochrome c family protein
VTEIPEHLLKRSRERRAALEDDPGASAAAEPTAATTPAPTQASTAAPAATSAAPAGRGQAAVPAAPPPAKPDSFVVANYKKRNRIPFWAMAALALLPIWAFMYARAVTTQAEQAAGPLAVGSDTYSVCASCHGGSGEGGVGYPFTGGEVLESFPHIEDQVRFVYYGSEQYAAAGVDVYSDPEREGGPRVVFGRNGSPMPGWGGNLTDAEILGVVCHERYDLGGGDPTGANATEYEEWCAEDSEIFADLEAGGDIRTLADRFPDILPIGEAPAPGSPADQ